MGQAARERPKRLGKKLRKIRTEFGLSQNGMIRALGLAERLSQDKVSAYERGTREPSLLVLLRYARFAGVSMEELVDDKINLPDKLLR